MRPPAVPVAESEDRYHDDLTVRLGRDEIRFSLSERIKHVRRRLTAAEKAARGWPGQEWTQTWEPTGELIFKLAGTAATSVPRTWRNEAEHPLEDRTSACLAGILTALAITRERREAREAEERRQRQREEAARRQDKARQAELRKKRGLYQRVAAWRAAAGLRDYVAAVRRAALEGGLSGVPHRPRGRGPGIPAAPGGRGVEPDFP